MVIGACGCGRCVALDQEAGEDKWSETGNGTLRVNLKRIDL